MSCTEVLSYCADIKVFLEHVFPYLPISEAAEPLRLWENQHPTGDQWENYQKIRKSTWERCLYGRRAATNHGYYSTKSYQYKYWCNGTKCSCTVHPDTKIPQPDLTQFPEAVPS